MYDFDIYTDGGYSRLYNKGAWAYVILRNGQIVTMDSKGESFATNNQMEIKGNVHCLFEKSGTFKNEFKKLGLL